MDKCSSRDPSTMWETLVWMLLAAGHVLAHGHERQSRMGRRRSVHARATTWTYVNCIGDGGTRTLTGFSKSSSANTVGQCINTCDSKGFAYAGMESECR